MKKTEKLSEQGLTGAARLRQNAKQSMRRRLVGAATVLVLTLLLWNFGSILPPLEEHESRTESQGARGFTESEIAEIGGLTRLTADAATKSAVKEEKRKAEEQAAQEKRRAEEQAAQERQQAVATRAAEQSTEKQSAKKEQEEQEKQKAAAARKAREKQAAEEKRKAEEKAAKAAKAAQAAQEEQKAVAARKAREKQAAEEKRKAEEKAAKAAQAAKEKQKAAAARKAREKQAAEEKLKAAEQAAQLARARQQAAAKDDPTQDNYHVQIGAFGKLVNAEKTAVRMEQKGFTIVLLPLENGQPLLWRVRAVGYDTHVAAELAQKQLVPLGFPKAQVVRATSALTVKATKKPAKPVKAPAKTSQGYTLRVGAFGKEANRARVIAAIKKIGAQPSEETTVNKKGVKITSVFISGIPTRKEALRLQQALKKAGIEGTKIEAAR